MGIYIDNILSNFYRIYKAELRPMSEMKELWKSNGKKGKIGMLLFLVFIILFSLSLILLGKNNSKVIPIVFLSVSFISISIGIYLLSTDRKVHKSQIKVKTKRLKQLNNYLNECGYSEKTIEEIIVVLKYQLDQEKNKNNDSFDKIFKIFSGIILVVVLFYLKEIDMNINGVSALGNIIYIIILFFTLYSAIKYSNKNRKCDKELLIDRLQDVLFYRNGIKLSK